MKSQELSLILSSLILLVVAQVNCSPLIDLFFTPGIDYEAVYKEKRAEMRHETKVTTRKICIKLDDIETKRLVQQLTCLEHNFSQYMASMASIWWQATGTEYPSNINEWRVFICSNKYFRILKSLIDGIYLARLMRANNMKNSLWGKFLLTYKSKCEHLQFNHLLMMFSIKNLTYDLNGQIVAPNEWDLSEVEPQPQIEPIHGILKDEDEFTEAVDFCDLEKHTLNAKQIEYCNLKKEYSNNLKLACGPDSTRGEKIRKELINKHKCLAESINSRHRKSLKYCWKLITDTEYPENSSEFVNFTCNHVYHTALRKTIDDCFDDRINGRHVSLNYLKYRIRAYLKQVQKKKHSCDFDIWKESDVKMWKVYSLRYYRLQFKFERHQFCHGKDPNLIGQVISDATCPMRKTTDEGKLILKFCWKFAGQVEYPSSFRQWKNLLCSKGPRQLAEMIYQIDSCFAIAPNIIFENKFKESNYILSHYFFMTVKQECLNGFPFASFYE